MHSIYLSTISKINKKMIEDLSYKYSQNPNFTRYRKLKSGKIKKNYSPVLSDILDSDNVPFILKFEPIDRKRAEELKCKKIDPNDVPIFRTNEQISYDRDDYFQVEIETTLQMEENGNANSLFLALSRALLYKVYFFDEKYEFILRKIISNYIELENDFRFDSDILLQEKLRKVMCVYWLKFIENGNFLPYTKYSESFENVFEFIYQIYQISVNNFCDNELFRKFAVEDISNIFNLKVFVFDSKDEKLLPKNKKLKICESYESKILKVNDCVFLELANDCEFKWLMPKTKFEFIKSIINIKEISYYFFKINSSYSKQKILLEPCHVKKCFSKEIKTNQNFIIFNKFLNEIAVHSLVSLNKLDFDLLLSSQDSNEIINYLNNLWGQNHFSLKSVLREIEPNRKAINFESVENKCVSLKKLNFGNIVKTECENRSSNEKIISNDSIILNNSEKTSCILKFSIENLLSNVNPTYQRENKKIKKKVYEYFQDDNCLYSQTLGQISNVILLDKHYEKKNEYRNTATSSSVESDFDTSLEHETSEKDTPKKEQKILISQKNSEVFSSNEFLNFKISKPFFNKKKTLDSCLTSLMKLSSSSSEK